MTQKTMMWKGVALVEAPARGPMKCGGCYFEAPSYDCNGGGEHVLEAQKAFGGECFERHNIIYVPAQPTESDAEWVEAKVADMRSGCDRERGEGIDDDAIRAALLAAIKRGRGE